MDNNPIEQLFAKLKHLLRKACARTVEATWSGAVSDQTRERARKGGRGDVVPALIPAVGSSFGRGNTDRVVHQGFELANV